MFVAMTMSGLTRHVTEHQVRALEALGWTRVEPVVVTDAKGEDAEKKTTSQKSPKRKTK